MYLQKSILKLNHQILNMYKHTYCLFIFLFMLFLNRYEQLTKYIMHFYVAFNVSTYVCTYARRYYVVSIKFKLSMLNVAHY